MLIGGIDSGVVAASLRMLPLAMRTQTAPNDDILARREQSGPLDTLLAQRFGTPAGVSIEDANADGVRVRIYTPAPMPSRGVLLYVHGGGLILGTVENYDARCSAWAANTGCTVVSVDYRLAPEHPFPAAHDDVMTALAWTNAHLQDFDATTIGIAGDSAGGGLAAAAALHNRDAKVAELSCQVLVYPMLDDKNTGPDDRFTSPLITWTFADNVIGWNSYLNDRAGAPDISPYAVPFREKKLEGLPPTYIDTGSMDIFLDEDVEYAKRMIAAGVTVEAHIWNGAIHGFDYFASTTALAEAAWAARYAFVRRYL